MTTSPCVLPLETSIIDSQDPIIEKRGDAEEPVHEVPLIEENIEKMFQIGTLLPEFETERLVECLRKNRDVFAWEASEMPGIDKKVIEHKISNWRHIK